ncbi:MAG: glycosyltransferase family 4 protein [Candidatus Berkelbacteria bacterium]|nr:MAG: glycosyltransferase family 4 protein [Candidatus Berkelbacteria bacterium]QQG51691.1 MAG: glycosyltransferase family 4 protein [Candidatus Berkelbacteria bacterium]
MTSSVRIAIDGREAVSHGAGKGRYIREIIRELSKLDHDNDYVIYSKQPLELELGANFESVIIGGTAGLRQLWLARDAQRRGCKVLFSPTGYLTTVFSRIPVVQAVHDLAIFTTPEARPALKTLISERFLLGYACNKARRITAVSQSTKNDLERLFGVPGSKISVDYLGYDHKPYHSQPAEGDEAVLKQHNLEKGQYLFYVGTIEPRKNLARAITAYQALPSKMKQRFPFIVAGGLGWHYEAIVEAAANERQVRLVGRVADAELPALYRNCRAFIFPSLYEGFGLPPLEAMACGAAVLSSNVSSLPEVIGDGGLLVEPTDITAISSAISRLLTDDTLVSSLGKKAAEQAVNFDWAKTANGVRQLLLEAAG